MSNPSSTLNSDQNVTNPVLPKSKPLSLSQQLAYALPVVSVGILLSLMGVVQGIYAKYFGLALTSIATAVLIARLFDVVTDLAIGYFSDRHHAQTGSRKPFILWGAVLFLLSGYFLFIPLSPEQLNASSAVSFGYFLAWSMIFYLAFTLFEIPHQSWGAEIAPTAIERNSLFSWRYVAWAVAGIAFTLIPFLPVFETHAFTPETLRWSVYLVALLLGPSLYLCLKHTPTPTFVHRKKEDYQLRVSTLISNKPMLLFYSANLFSGLAMGVLFGVLFIYIDGYLNRGEDFVIMLLAGTVIGLFAVPLWRHMANRWGKTTSMILGLVLCITGGPMMASISPNEADLWAVLWPFLILQLGLSARAVPLLPMLSDLVDYSQWKFKTDCKASYFALSILLDKASLALGSGLGIMIFGWYGFDPADPVYSAENVFAVRLALGWVPIPLFLLSIIFLLFIPITTHRHSLIRRRLDARAARLEQGEQQLSADKSEDRKALLNDNDPVTPY